MKTTLDITFGTLLILAFALFFAPLIGYPEWCFWSGFAPLILAAMVAFSNQDDDDNDTIYRTKP